MRPGMTGWAQVRYGYAVSQDDVTEKIRYDIYYVRHMSLWLDLRILFDTVKIMFSRQEDPPAKRNLTDAETCRASTPAAAGTRTDFERVRVESSKPL